MIHCHSAKGGIIGRTAGWITGVKTFYTPHAFSYLCTPSRLKRWVFMTIERLTRFKTYVLACSESEQEMAIKEVGYPEEHALVWHNAVPDSSLERGKVVDISEPYACYIGRPCYQKNPLFLLDFACTRFTVNVEKCLDITAFSLSPLIGNICTGSIS